MIGNTLFRNRIFSAPTGHPDTILGRSSDDVVSYFERKAKGGAACVTLGEATVDSVYGKGYPTEMSLDSFQPRVGLATVADAITRHGAIASIELQHAGLKATPCVETVGVGTSSDIVYGPSACEYRGVQVREMPEPERVSSWSRGCSCASFSSALPRPPRTMLALPSLSHVVRLRSS